MEKEEIVETRKFIKERMSSLKDFQAISDFKIGEIKEHTTTWEMLYPFMPQRLRAIEAAEWSFGTRFSAPPLDVADLYHEAHFYSWHYPDGGVDYRGSIEDGHYDREADLENKPENVKEVETLCWRMPVPNSVILADLYVRPIIPISQISMHVTIHRDGSLSFEEAIKEL